MQDNFHIRQATVADDELITDLSRITFTDSFGAQNTEADLFLYLSENFTADRIAAELAEKANVFFLAIKDQEAIGYLKLSWKEDDQSSIEIERIYVKKEFIGQKLGAALMAKAHDFALKNHFQRIWLGVWEKNETAIVFYKKWGFAVFGDHIFMLGNDAQTDLLMQKSLRQV